ncbi:uncharacterized protein [Diadema antillarum]|uniref:uncharacterized protein n=1 Tax=Diadema antillarum TaxID=105358 RepID=UPI003A8383E6
MEKSESQCDNNSSSLPPYAEMGADTAPPKASRFTSWRIPCTAVLITVLLVAGAITITAMAHKGSPQCPQSANSSRPNQVLDHDSTGHVELRGENGESASETVTYNSALNTVLINAPGNFSGSSPATIAIDFDRNVVFMNIHDQNTCVGFALEDKLAQKAKNFTRNKEHNQVIDLVSDKMETENYRDVGIIPAGYVQAANGPIIRGMCSGRMSQWLEVGTDGEMSQGRKRRFCFRICANVFGARVCYWRC